jgi:acid phosphatase (class A)
MRSGAHARITALCLGLFLAASAVAQVSYLRPGQPNGPELLAPPPLPGSAEEAADLASVRAVFKARTPAEKTRATTDSSLSFSLFVPAIGAEFDLAKLPKTQAMLEKVKTDIQEPIDLAKNYFKRKRPYQMDDSLGLGKPEPSFGYPSGHSIRGTVYAALLAELFPEKKEPVLAIGRDIGWDRVLIGKHFPSDIYAGRVVGQAIIRELKRNPAFQRDFSEAKAEIANPHAEPALSGAAK